MTAQTLGDLHPVTSTPNLTGKTPLPFVRSRYFRSRKSKPFNMTSLSPMRSSPTSGATTPGGPGTRTGRPPDWDLSRQRKLTRMYDYTILSMDEILNTLKAVCRFEPKKNAAQKHLNKNQGNDSRYLRPQNRAEMDRRIEALAASPTRHRKRFWSINEESPALSTIKDESPASAGVFSPQDTRAAAQGGTVGTMYDTNPAPDRQTTVRFNDPPPLLNNPTLARIRGGGALPHGILPFGRLGGLRQETMATTSSSNRALSQIKRTLSGKSETFCRNVRSLLRHFTIADHPAGLISPSTFRMLGTENDSSECLDLEVLVPGDFISAGNKVKECPCSSGIPCQEKHKCWNAIAAELSRVGNLWVSPDGLWTQKAMDLLAQHLTRENLSDRDAFGHTPLHFFATRTSLTRHVLKALQVHPGLAGERNTAGQTFLHVLAEELFQNVGDPRAPLHELLSAVRAVQPDLVYVRDVYGRSFFHRLQSLVGDTQAFQAILQQYSEPDYSRRDAMARKPFAASPSRHPELMHRRAGTLAPLGDDDPDNVRFHDRWAVRPTNEDRGYTIQHSAGLLQVVRVGLTHPRVETSAGQNALHCLAEAALVGRPDARPEEFDRMYEPPPLPPPSAGRARPAGGRSRPLKRKLDRKDDPQAPGHMGWRLGVARDLVAAGVDANGYDNEGTTVLMALVEHAWDHEDDKGVSLRRLLELLLGPGPGGGGAEMEARNRMGETALLVAARLGRKVALEVLLERGANVHARNANGRGVLDIVDHCCVAADRDPALYGRLETCRVLLTGRRNYGVVQTPSIVQEWSVRPAAA